MQRETIVDPGDSNLTSETGSTTLKTAQVI
jgi:hypothetical protein